MNEIDKAITENNEFLIANMKSIMNEHKEPSPVTLEMIKRLEEWIKEIKSDNKDRDKDIMDKLGKIEQGLSAWIDTVNKEHTEIKKDVREMQDWKLVSKTERAFAYSVAALVGSLIGSLILMAFNKLLLN